MSSLKQIEANRLNALKSTGPITPEGKGRSRCNAIRHGLTAETVIAELEDAEDYQSFEAAVIADYNAETAVERELVLRLASVLWRLRRATGIETALFERVIEGASVHDNRSTSNTYVAKAEPSDQLQIFSDVAGQPNGAATDESTVSSRNNIATAFLRLAELPTFALDRLSRYEHLLWRQARQIVFTLESMRRRTRKLSHLTFPFAFHRRDRHFMSEEPR